VPKTYFVIEHLHACNMDTKSEVLFADNSSLQCIFQYLLLGFQYQVWDPRQHVWV